MYKQKKTMILPIFCLVLLFSITACSRANSIVNFGDKASSFTVKSYDSKSKTIGEYTYIPGKWTVLYFYPADFTFVCPTEIAAMQSVYEKFENMDVELLGISTDSVDSHAKWHKEESRIANITYPLLSDSDRLLSKMFNVYNKNQDVSRRATVILNPEGEIVMLEIVHDNLGRSSSEILRKVQALRFMSENTGVCAANWIPGEDTIKVPA